MWKTLAQYEKEAKWVNNCLVHTGRRASHRVYILRHGPLPYRKHVKHICNNGSCILDEHQYRGKQTPEALFWMKVEKRGSAECWLWKGKISRFYGRLRVNNKMEYAHRFAYSLLVYPVPKEIHVDHLCQNKLCVNPAHLELITATEHARQEEPIRSATTGRFIAGAKYKARAIKPTLL